MAGAVAFELTEDDAAGAARAWFWAKLWTRRFFGVMALGAGVVALCGIVMTHGDSDPALPGKFTGAMVAGFVVLMILMMVVSYFVQVRAARRLLRQNKAARGLVRVAWDDQGVVMESPSGRSEFRWVEYHDWIEGRDALLLMMNERLYHMLPRRVLDESQFADLRRLAALSRTPVASEDIAA